MKKISIFGYGVTTKAIVEFLNQKGESCNIFDDSFKEERTQGSNILLPVESFDAKDSKQEITSPGIPPYHPLIIKSKNLVSEYDLFFDYFKEKSIWISGTNGKTTTTQMLEFLLQKTGGKSGGNIGFPLAKLVDIDPSIWILETSSFALHYTKQAYPKCYVLLPIREDHISWHGSFENYILDKLSPLSRMQKENIAFIPSVFRDYEICKNAQAQIIFYESAYQLAQEFDIAIEKIVFKEPFLLDSILALCATKFINNELDIGLLNQFKIGAHRIEEFYDSKGRLWVDDSKGTNVDATCEAIKRYHDKKIYLILGGDDKGAKLEPIFEIVKDLNIELFLIGSNASRLQTLSESYMVKYLKCDFLNVAVEGIKQKLQKDEVALLSPAAASLDQFSSYKERGELFKKLALGD